MLMLVVSVQWVLFACWWSEWGDWTIIGIALGQFLCIVLLLTGDAISYDKYKKKRIPMKKEEEKYDCDDCKYYPCSANRVLKGRKIPYGICGDHSERATP